MGITKTKQGEIEVNNPALAVVVPENLRSNANLMRNLRRNSRQLTTHFDTYATLVNIARVSRDQNCRTGSKEATESRSRFSTISLVYWLLGLTLKPSFRLLSGRDLCDF